MINWVGVYVNIYGLRNWIDFTILIVYEPYSGAEKAHKSNALIWKKTSSWWNPSALDIFQITERAVINSFQSHFEFKLFSLSRSLLTKSITSLHFVAQLCAGDKWNCDKTISFHLCQVQSSVYVKCMYNCIIYVVSTYTSANPQTHNHNCLFIRKLLSAALSDDFQ